MKKSIHQCVCREAEKFNFTLTITLTTTTLFFLLLGRSFYVYYSNVIHSLYKIMSTNKILKNLFIITVTETSTLYDIFCVKSFMYWWLGKIRHGWPQRWTFKNVDHQVDGKCFSRCFSCYVISHFSLHPSISLTNIFFICVVFANKRNNAVNYFQLPINVFFNNQIFS